MVIIQHYLLKGVSRYNNYNNNTIITNSVIVKYNNGLHLLSGYMHYFI